MVERPSLRGLRALLAVALLGACAAPQPGGTVATSTGGIQLRPVPSDQQVPDYAKRPYEPFSRENVVQIALREWRAWGMPVNDSPPGRDMPVQVRPDRQAGMWQRVGDYWWLGQNALSNGSGWTGKYGDFGAPIAGEPAAWSAAFISYVMRVAGAGDRFPYSALHATYINAAAGGNPILAAQPPETYPPQQGDLICYGRRGAERLRFSDLPASSFYGHCDIVVSADPGMLTVIGGNVSAGVTTKHVPVTPTGTLADANGRVADGRYPWFVVLRVTYDSPGFTPVSVGIPVAAAPMVAPSVVPTPFVAAPEEEAVPVAEPVPTQRKRPVARAKPTKRPMRRRY